MAKRKELEVQDEPQEIIKTVPRFTKAQILNAGALAFESVVTNSVLKEGETYTIEEAEDKIEKFLKGKVN